jgi:hypothetical protein
LSGAAKYPAGARPSKCLFSFVPDSILITIGSKIGSATKKAGQKAWTQKWDQKAKRVGQKAPFQPSQVENHFQKSQIQATCSTRNSLPLKQ